MPTASLTRWLPLGLAVGLAAGAAAYGQQKYNLRHPAAPGDVCTVDSSMDMSLMLSVNIPGSGEGDQQLPFTERFRQSYREKVLAADANGVSAVRRTYTVARGVITDPYLHDTVKVSSVQGKTVTLRRVGDQVKVSVDRGKLSPVDEKALAQELSHSDSEFFPDHGVAPGDEWPIDSRLMRGIFPGMDSSEARYRFQQVVTHDHHPCAQIHVTVEMHGLEPGSQTPMTVQLAGDLYHALDLKRTVDEEETGPVSLSGSRTQNGTTTHVTGQGTLRVKETHRWLTVDGHPVAGEG